MYDKDYQETFDIHFLKITKYVYQVYRGKYPDLELIGEVRRPDRYFYGWVFIPEKRFNMGSTLGPTRCFAVEQCFGFEKAWRKIHGYPNMKEV